jgi:hypothetical protein
MLIHSAVGIPTKEPISALLKLGNDSFWSWMDMAGVGFRHHVRPLRSLRGLNVDDRGWHPEHAFRFGSFMGTCLFFLALCMWQLKVKKRALSMVSCMWSVLCQVVGLLPQSFSLPVAGLFSISVEAGCIRAEAVLALLGYLRTAEAWNKLFPDNSVQNVLRHGLVHFKFVMFALWRWADYSIDCRELAVCWMHKLAKLLDSSGFNGKLLTDIPHMVLPKNSRINTKLAIRSDDKHLLAAHRFLGKNTGFGSSRSRGDEILLKDLIDSQVL